jgi:hypothetical protein
MNLLDWLANSSYALWVNQSAGWPLALTIHAFGTAVVVGFMAIIGLRLLGFFREISYYCLNSLFPYIWVAIVFQVLSGFTLWMTKPAQYLADGMFEVKFTLVIISAIVLWYFQKIMKNEAAKWDVAGAVSPRGLKIGLGSCLLWAGVTIGGRLTAYLGSLYLQ